MHEVRPVDVAEVAALRSLIDEFLHGRLQTKLEKLDGSDTEKSQRLLENYQREAWLADAAHRIEQIQFATHTLKAIHPDARGTNVYLRNSIVVDDSLVGTHCLTKDRTDDVVGNAAALDVVKFLNLSLDGKSVLARALDDDPALLAALSDDLNLAHEWIKAFDSVVETKGEVASHTLAKQLYFPLDDGTYHLVAPLFPSTLAHHLHATLQGDRFSEAAQNARRARNNAESWPHGFREYPNLAVQKLGGTKPQNISQLNSELGGRNHLLASMPPIWQSTPFKAPMRQNSVFELYGAFGRRPEVRRLTETLRTFLMRVGVYNNLRIRETRAELVDDIIEQLFLFAAQIQSLPSGWSSGSDCQLDATERRWLDPRAAVPDAEGARASSGLGYETTSDWFVEIASRFANWLNSAIGTDRTPMGDDEHLAWKTLVIAAQHQIEQEISDEA